MENRNQHKEKTRRITGLICSLLQIIGIFLPVITYGRAGETKTVSYCTAILSENGGWIILIISVAAALAFGYFQFCNQLKKALFTCCISLIPAIAFVVRYFYFDQYGNTPHIWRWLYFMALFAAFVVSIDWSKNEINNQ